jgi:hypothetical protein
MWFEVDEYGLKGCMNLQNEKNNIIGKTSIVDVIRSLYRDIDSNVMISNKNHAVTF